MDWAVSAAAIHNLRAIVVVLNSLRLYRFHRQQHLELNETVYYLINLCTGENDHQTVMRTSMDTTWCYGTFTKNFLKYHDDLHQVI